MTEKDGKNLVFDSSALLKFSNNEAGSSKVHFLFGRKDCRFLASSLTAFEILSKLGRFNIRNALKALAFFREFFDFLPVDLELSKKAALLKLKYSDLNLSTVDSIIIQTGIENNAEIVTSDKEWSKVSEVKIILV